MKKLILAVILGICFIAPVLSQAQVVVVVKTHHRHHRHHHPYHHD